MSVDAFPPALTSLITRAAIAFISGPALKRIRAFNPNRLLKAASISASPFLPPKVVGPATKKSSFSFFAAEINCSGVSAKTEHG